MERSKILWLPLVTILIILSFSFGERVHSFYDTNWLIIEVDTAGSGYFKVDTNNRIILRMNKFSGRLYALDGNSECCAIPKIKKRQKGVCRLETTCHSMERIDSSRLKVTMRTTDRDALYFTNFLKKLEYRRYLHYFLEESKGELIFRNDTLIYDMKVLRMGKELPFKIKCVRE